MSGGLRAILTRFPGGSSTADIGADGSCRLSTRIGGKREQRFDMEPDEAEKLRVALNKAHEWRLQAKQADERAAAERQRIIDEAKVR